MQGEQAPTITTRSGRVYTTFPAAVVVPIVNARRELLLLENPRREGWWEPVNGGVDAGETLLDAALREVREEAGDDVRVRPLGVIHASTFAYDANVQRMISVVYLMAYEGGEPSPGDDMVGSRVRWASLQTIDSERLRLLPPMDQLWLRQRAIDLFELWEGGPPVALQRPIAQGGWNKIDDLGTLPGGG